MQLDDRKKKILKAIIQTYLETGDPVGSRTISKYTDLHLSSATIRNEMKDLEEMGYIIQPHTSAGRIPSDKGYRLYVDELIKEKNQEIQDVKELMIKKTDRLEKVMRQVVKVLAVNTNYATMIMPAVHSHRLKFIQLSRLNDEQILAVIVAEGNLVKNQLIGISEPITDEALLKLNLLLNTQLNGLSIGEINLKMIQNMKQQAGIHSEVIGSVVDAVGEAIKPDDEANVYTSGVKNIFKYPELADSANASELISALEDKQELAAMLRETGLSGDEETGIQVYIGQEAPIENMNDVSVITANYDLGGGMKGRIGIVGPRRMDYKNVVDNLKKLKKELESIFGTNKVKLNEVDLEADIGGNITDADISNAVSEVDSDGVIEEDDADSGIIENDQANVIEEDDEDSSVEEDSKGNIIGEDDAGDAVT